jgi:peptidoglycan/LPS O-acetylase OafA/YrhL
MYNISRVRWFQPVEGPKYRAFGTLRFALSLIVFLGHSGSVGLPEWARFISTMQLGNVAVMLFFILSGFIVSESYLTFYSKSPNAFLINRFLRIAPPYFYALGVSLLVHYSLYSVDALILLDAETFKADPFSVTNVAFNFLMLFALYGLSFIGVPLDYTFVRYIWAVRVEVHFYVVFYLYCMFWESVPVATKQLVVWFFAILLALSVLAISTNYSFLNYFNFTGYFLLGILLYAAVSRASCWSAMFILAFSISFLLSTWHFYTYVSRTPGAAAIAITVIFALGIFLIPALYYTPLATKAKLLDRFLGDLSYPVYLNHYAATVLVHSLIGNRGAYSLAASFTLTLALSFLSISLVERRLKIHRNKVRGFVIT